MKRPSSADKGKRLRFGWGPVLAFALLLTVGTFALVLRPAALPETQPLSADIAPVEVEQLRSVNDFEDILDPSRRSIALFEEAGRVILHPRCMNCHPRADQPTQTGAMRPHMPWVSRGPDGGGEPALRCSSCHNDANFEASGAPGNPAWRLAPLAMGWQGLTLGEICRQIQDPARGGMTHDELRHHMAEDSLVGWAWNPGGGRSSPPGSQQAFGSLVDAWIATGAECPQ